MSAMAFVAVKVEGLLLPRSSTINDNGVDGMERETRVVAVIHNTYDECGALEAAVGASSEGKLQLVDREEGGVDFGSYNILVVTIEEVRTCRPSKAA